MLMVLSNSEPWYLKLFIAYFNTIVIIAINILLLFLIHQLITLKLSSPECH